MTFDQLMRDQDAFIERHIQMGADEFIKDMATGRIVQVIYRSPVTKALAAIESEHASRMCQFLHEEMVYSAATEDRDAYAQAAAKNQNCAVPNQSRKPQCAIHGCDLTFVVYDRPGSAPGNTYACEKCAAERSRTGTIDNKA